MGRQQNSSSGALNDFNTILDQAANVKLFYFYMWANNCWYTRDGEGNEWKHNCEQVFGSRATTLGGGGYRTELVDIEVCPDELTTRSTERCETNLAPALSSHARMDRRSHPTSEAKQRCHVSRVLWVNQPLSMHLSTK